MANQELPQDPPASISAAELRRRLLASTPPPLGVPGSPSIDVEALAAQSTGSQRSRLTMPGSHGPVAASSLPPVVDSAIPEVPILPTRSRLSRLDQSALLGGGGSIGGSGHGVPSPIGDADAPLAPPAKGGSSNSRVHTEDDYRRLKQENRELRKLLEEMKQLLQEASDNEQAASAREAELREQMGTKQRQVDDVTAQLQEIEAQVASGALTQAPPVPKTRTELEEWADELEREAAKMQKQRREMDEERKQLRDDEQSLEKQMRDMEVSMARERALMARQETELKRLSAEIQHELELMQRGDANLREQLNKFQRRATDVMQGKIGPGGGGGGPPSSGGRR